MQYLKNNTHKSTYNDKQCKKLLKYSKVYCNILTKFIDNMQK